MLTQHRLEWIAEQFHGQGYAVMPGVIEPEVVHSAREAVAELVDGIAAGMIAGMIAEGIVADGLSELPLETRLYRLCANHPAKVPAIFREELHLPGFYGLFFHPVLLEVAERLLGKEVRLYPNYTVRPKLPDLEAARVLWHQDGGYTHVLSNAGDVDALHMVNVWSPLVSATVENGCMQFIPGTHKLGIVPHEQKKYYLEIADDVLQPRLAEAVDIELEPGDVVFFHNLLFHQGLPNRSNHIRWSLDWRYQDAEQNTLRVHQGHLARSEQRPDDVVRTKEQWAELTFK